MTIYIKARTLAVIILVLATLAAALLTSILVQMPPFQTQILVTEPTPLPVLSDNLWG